MRDAIQDFQSVGGIDNLFGILFPKRLVLFFEVLGKHRCRAGGDVEWAKRATERLERRYDLNAPKGVNPRMILSHVGNGPGSWTLVAGSTGANGSRDGFAGGAGC